MKSKSLLFLTLCLFFNACSNEDELMTPDSKRVKREMSKEERDRYWRKSIFRWALINHQDLLVRGCKDAKEWKELIDFRPVYSVEDKMDKIDHSWFIQHIQNAMGNIVNMDYFPITIEQMPTVNGEKMSPLKFFEHVRKHINDFIGFYTGVKFRPIDTVFGGSKLEGETELWKSDNPFLALLSIKIPIDEGSVICSDYNKYLDYHDEYVEADWKFTTISSGIIDGTHPVSGNREFGYFKNYNGYYTFYTRGVDRLWSTYILGDLFSGFPIMLLAEVMSFGTLFKDAFRILLIHTREKLRRKLPKKHDLSGLR